MKSLFNFSTGLKFILLLLLFFFFTGVSWSAEFSDAEGIVPEIADMGIEKVPIVSKDKGLKILTTMQNANINCDD